MKVELSNKKIGSYKDLQIQNISKECTELYLQCNELRSLEEFPDLPNLSNLNLGSNQLNILEGFSNLSNLTNLNLWNNKLTSL